jgi:hypothetical protein
MHTNFCGQPLGKWPLGKMEEVARIILGWILVKLVTRIENKRAWFIIVHKGGLWY